MFKLAVRSCLGSIVVLLALLPGALVAQQHPNHRAGFEPEKLYQFDGLENVNLFNGNLNLTIPLGGDYPVGGSFSYDLALTYSGNVWEWEEICPNPANGEECYLKAIPRKSSNAGLGWLVSLGRLNPPRSPLNNVGRTIYQSPDGADHLLEVNLHADGTSTSGVSYTQDGTYLRYKSTPRELELPDGTVRTFDAAGLLTQVRDRFGNSLSITYPASATYANIKDWKLTDSLGRIHWVYFKPAVYYGAVADRVVLKAFNGTTASYTFNYSTPQVTRGWTDPYLVTAGLVSRTETVPLLTGVTLPDGSTFSMPVTDYDSGPATGTSSLLGHLKGMKLPTGGRMEWDWIEYIFPDRSALLTPSQDPYQPRIAGDPFTRSVGLSRRRHENSSGSLLGEWTYTPSYDTALPPKEHKVSVADPLGHISKYYFSVYVMDSDPQTPEPSGWFTEEYGLPFTRNQADETTPGRYLSAEIQRAGGTTLRKIYVRYERDGLSQANPRLASERTVYVDDGSKYADVTYSSFDGLGHYRQATTGGNFGAADVRTTSANYNPGSCATCTPLTTAPWVLGTYDYQTATEGGVTARTDACFDAATVFLLRTRTLKTGTTAGANDLVTRYSKDAAGNLTAEELFGGDTQSLGTGSLCTLTLPAAKYRVDNTYQYGSLKTSQATGMPFKSLDRDIDSNTGLVKTSRDSALLATTYEYDALGRLTYVKPAQEGWTQFVYGVASGTTPAKVWIYSKSNGGGTTLASEEVHFDPFGRVAVERQTLASGSTAGRKTTYDAVGNVTSKTEWGTTAATSYLSYDPFGRPGTIRPPDGSAHDVVLSYNGVRVVTRKVKVGTAWSGTAVTESQATTTETTDRQGRLYQVFEPANPDGTSSTTTYTYDVGNRLKQVSQTAKTTAGTNTTQTRIFNYDNRGFLTSERHPETGATGNGYVYYYDYDAGGNAGRIADGPNDLTFTYDGAERVTRIRETGTGFAGCTTTWSSGPRCLKEFTYGTANGTGDYRLGKLQVAKRYNYPALGTTTYTAVVNETYTYGGKQGRVSARETSLTFNGSTNERFTQSWTWNDLGDVATVGYPGCSFTQCNGLGGSRTVSYGYTQGFLTSVGGYATAISYHASGQVNQVTRANGVVDTYSKDPYNQPRPQKIEAKLGTTLLWSTGAYSYDGAGNVVKAGSAYYLYDLVSRIKSGLLYLGPGAGGATTTFDHSYDGFGNLLSLATTTTRNTPTSSSTNRLTGAVSYDAAGNLTSWNGATYEYDGLGMMKRMVNGTEKWLYMYTADDERFWAYKEGASPRFDRFTLRDLDGRVLRTWEASNYVWSWTEDHVYRAGTLLASVTPSATTQLHTDHLGTVRAMTNAAGSRTAYHIYYPFGEEATSITQNTERMKFTGHERDLGVTTSAADDLDYMHARYYNPQTGRFMSVDPSRESSDPKQPQSWNRYTYTRSNPLNFVDPDGKVRACAPEDCAPPKTWWEKAKRDLDLALMLPGPAPLAAARVPGAASLLVRTKPVVSSPELANVVNQLFKAGDRLVGGTANAVRIELATGEGVAGRIHIQAGLQRLKGLQDLLRGGGLSGEDTGTALRLARDLKTALQPLLNRLGMTADQLRKALSSGQLTQDELLKMVRK